MNTKNNVTSFLILPTRPEDALALEALQEIVYGGRGYRREELINAEMYKRHIEIFPQGQFVAIDAYSGHIVGCTSSMLCKFDDMPPAHHSWYDITDHGWLTPHQPDGNWLYFVDSCVHPSYQGRGIGKQMTHALFELCRHLNRRGMIGGSLIMNYAKFAGNMTPHHYVQEVVAGTIFDNNLTKQIKMGFRVEGLLPGYVPDDSTQGYGVQIVWENSVYTQAKLAPV